MAADPHVKVFYDGSCALCRASRRWLERRDAAGALEFVDACAAGAAHPPGVTADQLARAVWAELAGGRLVSGYDALVAALAALPRRGRAAQLAAVAPLRWAGRHAYRLVARNRRLGARRR